MKKQSKEKLLTRKQCANFFSVSLPTIHKWVNDGIIQAYKMGGRIYFKQRELFDALKKT